MAKRVKVPGRLESAETGNIVTGADAVMDDERGKTQVVVNNEVEAAILSLAQNKQNVLTFDNAPTEGSTNPVTSAGVYTADKALSDAIKAVLLLIPSAASALNKLVDVQTMNSSIATGTASFKGTYNLVSDLHLGVDATHEQIGAALDALSLGADNNDYAFVLVPNSAMAPTEISKTERYKFNGTNWLFEYDLNNSGFTSEQWNAINSGVTSLLVGKLSDLPTDAELTTLMAGKQDNLTFDNAPTAGSSNPVKSGGVYARNNEIVALINALDVAKQNVLTFDNAPVEGSPNPVKSGGVYTAISAVQAAIVALDAAKQNVLTFDSTPTLGSTNPVTSSGIKTELNRIDGNVTTLNDLYEALTQSALVIVQPTDTWPVASPATKTIYRVVDRVNTPPQYYSDYMWNGSAMVLMATYNNAIDPRPKKASQNLVTSGGVFDNMGALDVSELNATENPHTIAKYVDLSAALAAVQKDYQKGGMSIKFVQSSDNKYVQYRLMANSFNTTVADWQGVDDVPTTGSSNLVKSGGVDYALQDTDGIMNLFGKSGGAITEYHINLKIGRVYKLKLSKTNWATTSISSNNPIFSYGYYNTSNIRTIIKWYRQSEQSQIVDTIILNTNSYIADISYFYIGFACDENDGISISIEDITEASAYKKVQATQGETLGSDKTLCNIALHTDNDVRVSYLIESECLGNIWIAYYSKQSGGSSVVLTQTAKQNKLGFLTIPENTDLIGLAIYVPSSDVLASGDVKISFVVENQYSSIINNLDGRTVSIEKQIADSLVWEKSISATAGTEINGNHSMLDVDIPAGTVYSFIVIDNSGVLKTNSESNYYYAQVNYEDETFERMIVYYPNVLQYRLEQKRVVSAYIYAASGAVAANGTISFRVAECKDMDSIDYAALIKKAFTNISILGDSWSTYYGWIPQDNTSWYAFDGIDGHNARAGEEHLNDVDSVKKTWWWKMSNETKVSLLVNESFSGSCIANAGAQTPFIPRMKTSIGEDRALQPKPDIIFVEGGTNDYYSSVNVGDLQYSGWTETDLQSTIPAFCYILDYLQKWNPSAIIVTLINPAIGDAYKSKMKSACEHYGVRCFEMYGIAKQNNHPSIAGMEMIKEQVIGYLNGVLEGLFE